MVCQLVMRVMVEGWVKKVLGLGWSGEGLSENVIFEQVPEGGEGRGLMTLWGKVCWVAEDPSKIQKVESVFYALGPAWRQDDGGREEEEGERSEMGKRQAVKLAEVLERIRGIGELLEGFEQRSDMT